APLFSWSCTGFSGGTTAPCTAPDATGICASVQYVRNGKDGDTGTVAPNPLTDFMCLEGTPGPVTHGVSWDGVQNAWMWNCIGTVPNPADEDSCTYYDANGPQPGGCGNDNGQVFTSN